MPCCHLQAWLVGMQKSWDLLPLLGWAAAWFPPGLPAPPPAFSRELGCGPYWVLMQPFVCPAPTQPPGASSSSGRRLTGDEGCAMQAAGEEGEGQDSEGDGATGADPRT